MPTASGQERSERLEARISRDLKALFKQAAQLQGRTLSDFVVQAASEVAYRVVEEHRLIRLTEKEQAVFVDALLNPPLPGSKLKAAFRHYREVMGR